MRFLLLFSLVLALGACAADPAPDTALDITENTSTNQPEPVLAATTVPADAPVVTVYKSPTCGCCTLWAEHMTSEGFQVETRDVANLTAIRDSLGMPADLSSCHTATVEGYVVEGHVPGDQVRRMLAERPEARGLSVPGMPLGSPGMEQGSRRQPYDVLLVGSTGEAVVYAHIPGSAP